MIKDIVEFQCSGLFHFLAKQKKRFSVRPLHVRIISVLFLQVILGLYCFKGYCQSRLPIATNFRKAYATGTRNNNGSPGINYWQNTASYNITVSFSPLDNILSGTETIDYVNNSPDSLSRIAFKLYPNLYQSQSMRNVQVLPEDLNNGVEMQAFSVNGEDLQAKQILIRETNMFIKGITIPPGKTVHFDIKYSYKLNKTSFIRTGQIDSGAYVIAYFFPRIAVYDDIDGWNEYPYAGKEEFYNDYCNFNVTIKVPDDYQVWATGDLVNPDEVYKPEILKRLSYAQQTDNLIDMISADDLAGKKVCIANGINAWQFQANNVTDFAFAVSNHYVWKSSSIMVDPQTKRRTRVDAVFNPLHKNFEPVINYNRKTVELISYDIPGIPFPYPHETIFEGLDAMEYPMMVNNLPFEGIEAIQFTAHEVYHTLFPFLVGTNETKYSFMDEGWATFSEFALANKIVPGTPDNYDLSSVNESAGSDQDVPIMTLTPQLYGKARFSDKDLKPALGLRYIREMLGDSLFCKAMKYYIQQWQGKHPTPYDFFNCINKGSGSDLNWFWQNWFFEKNAPDLAIEKVQIKPHQCTVIIKRNEEGMVPVHLSVFYKDGTGSSITKNISCWKNGNRAITITISAQKQIAKIILGEAYDADVNMSNNVWSAGKY